MQPSTNNSLRYVLQFYSVVPNLNGLQSSDMWLRVSIIRAAQDCCRHLRVFHFKHDSAIESNCFNGLPFASAKVALLILPVKCAKCYKTKTLLTGPILSLLCCTCMPKFNQKTACSLSLGPIYNTSCQKGPFVQNLFAGMIETMTSFAHSDLHHNQGLAAHIAC